MAPSWQTIIKEAQLARDNAISEKKAANRALAQGLYNKLAEDMLKSLKLLLGVDSLTLEKIVSFSEMDEYMVMIDDSIVVWVGFQQFKRIDGDGEPRIDVNIQLRHLSSGSRIALDGMPTIRTPNKWDSIEARAAFGDNLDRLHREHEKALLENQVAQGGNDE